MAADFMAGAVGSAVAQEVVTRVFSLVLDKHKEKVSREHGIERLEMAHAELELALERSSKFPLTDASLLRRRKILKRALEECGNVLYRSKIQALQGEKDPRIMAMDSSFPRRIVRAARSSFAHLFTPKRDDNDISCSDVRRFTWFADCAGRFVRDVESGCSLWHYTFCNSIARHLLEGKALTYEMMQGSQVRRLLICPMFFQEHGVEALLGYWYRDKETSEKDFVLGLMLRLSESTDIVGIAVKCLQSTASRYNIVAEWAMRELFLLPNLQADSMSHSSYVPPVGIQETYAKGTLRWRPNPVCCKADRHHLPESSLSLIFSEEVVLFGFSCYISAAENSLCSSISEAGGSVIRDWPPLGLMAVFLPHVEGVEEGIALEIMGGAGERRYGSTEQIVEMVRSKAAECLIHKPELTDYKVGWASKHGAAYFEVQKFVTASKPKGKWRAAKRRQGGHSKSMDQKAKSQDKAPQEEEIRLPFKLGMSLATEKQLDRLGWACQRLHYWHMRGTNKTGLSQYIPAKYTAEHLLPQSDFFLVSFDDLYNLFHLDALDVALVRCWTLYMMGKARCNKMLAGFLNPQQLCEDTIKQEASNVEEYITKAMIHNQDKTYIIAPYNFQLQWILIVIDPKQSKVVYLDSLNTNPEDYKLVTDLIDRSFEAYIAKGGEHAPGRTKLRHRHQFPCHKQTKGTNTSGYYVCQHMQEIASIKPEDVEWIKIPTSEILPSKVAYIRGQLAHLLLSSVMNKEVEFPDPDTNKRIRYWLQS
ncbi:hypothetical protein ACP4OV_011836 [Aristida adscensionis]